MVKQLYYSEIHLKNIEIYLSKLYTGKYSEVNDVITGADPGGLWGLKTPLQKYIREAKRMMYWYKNTLFLELSDISVLYEIKQPISSKGLKHPPYPLLHIWFFVFT